MTDETQPWVREGERIAAAMRRVWKLSGRPDPFRADSWGTFRSWEAFGLTVAAALEAPPDPQPAGYRYFDDEDASG